MKKESAAGSLPKAQNTFYNSVASDRRTPKPPKVALTSMCSLPRRSLPIISEIPERYSVSATGQANLAMKRVAETRAKSVTDLARQDRPHLVEEDVLRPPAHSGRLRPGDRPLRHPARSHGPCPHPFLRP